MVNFYIKKHNLQPADRIVTPKSSLKWVQHHVIYLGQNYDGVDLIIENKVGHGVRIISADEFFAESPAITRIEKFRGNGYERQVAVQRALAYVGQSYSLINFNCESFANFVQHSKIESRQSYTGLGLGLLALTLLVAGVASSTGRNKK